MRLVDLLQEQIRSNLQEGCEGTPVLKVKTDGGEPVVEAANQVEDESVVVVCLYSR